MAKSSPEQRLRIQKLLAASGQVDVFSHSSINEYLKEIYLKADKKDYSYKKFSEDLGFSHTNVLWLYMNGKRKMSVKSGKVICRSLKLKGGAKRYAEQLIRLESITLHQSREKIFQQLIKLKKKFGSDKSTKRKIDYHSQWYFPLIREYIAVNPEKSSPEEIAKHFLFNLFPKQIQEGIRVLTDLNLIELDPATGKYKVNELDEGNDRKGSGIAHTRHHQKVCELSSEAPIRVEKEFRELSAMTLGLKESDIPRIKEFIRGLCEESLKLDDPRSAERIFQLNVQFFAVTDKIRDDQ